MDGTTAEVRAAPPPPLPLEAAGGTVAIASPWFAQPSLTFVRDHVRHLAPERTILVSQNPAGLERFGHPSLVIVDSASPLNFVEPPVDLRARLAGSIQARWRAYAARGLVAADRRRLVAFLRAHRAEALLVEFGDFAVRLADAAEDAGVRLYPHFHGYDASLKLRYPHVVHEYRRLFRQAARVITPSRFIGEKLISIGLPEAKLGVSPCGVDPDRFEPSRREPGRVVAVGRLVDKKAPHLTIKAFAEMAPRVPEAWLDLVGDGPLMERCRRLVVELGLKDRVCLHGAQPPEVVAELMGRATLFVQHSVTASNGDTEGLPVALLEAMAAAVPVVVTRHNGFPEAVVEGETGLLVEEFDVHGMAHAMERVLGDPELAGSMGEAGRRRVLERHTHEKTRDRLRAIMALPPAC